MKLMLKFLISDHQSRPISILSKKKERENLEMNLVIVPGAALELKEGRHAKRREIQVAAE